MSLDDLIKLIQNFGFPVVVAGYLLWRIEPILRRIAESQAAQLEVMHLFADNYLSGVKQRRRRRISHRRGKLT